MVDDPSPVRNRSHFGRGPKKLMMHLERCAPLQRKPDRFIVSLVHGLSKDTEERERVRDLPLDVRTDLEEFGGIEQDGHRTFVHQFDAHHFPEATRFAAQAQGLNPLHKEIVQLPGVLGRCGGLE
jgi:hypothetical protein